MDNQSPTYSVVIPCYGTDKSIIELAKRIHLVFTDHIKENYEVIFIDDFSPNINTWTTLKDVKQMFPHNTSIIQLTRNFGKAGAVLCGFSKVKGDYVITLDDDLQQSPEDILKLIPYKEKNDVVIGYFKNKNHNFFKKSSSKIKRVFDYYLIGKPKHIHSTPFKLFQRKIVDEMVKIKTPYPFIAALMFYVTKNIKMIEVSHNKRMDGKSNFSTLKRIKQFSNLLINNSSFLLRFVAFIGLLTAFFSFSYGTLIFTKQLFFNGSKVAGWTSIMVVTLILGGLILLSIGITGEYLIRIIKGVESRPPFIIKKEL